jgi:hypothetical protein
MLTNFSLMHKLNFHYAIILAIFVAVSDVNAQQNQPVAPSVPPPMKFVPSEDRKQLSEVTDPKSHLKLAIELAEERLSKAENFANMQQFDKTLTELGYYHGLIEKALEFLERKTKRDKIRDLFKRLELTLRTHSSRLQGIRRISPYEYNQHIENIFDYTIEARNRSLNAFFGDDVLKEKPTKTSPPVSNKSEANEKKKP